MIKKIKEIIPYVILGLLIFFLWQNYKMSTKLSDNAAIIESLKHDTEIYRNELGQSIAKNKTLQTVDINSFTNAVFNSEDMKRLQSLVSENNRIIKKSGFAAITDVTGKVNQVTRTIIEKDSVSESYNSYFKDKWVEYKINANKDSVTANFKYFEQLELVAGYEYPKEFSFWDKIVKNKVPTATVKSLNPYSTISTFESYSKKRKPVSKIQAGLIFGYGVGNGGETGLIIGAGLSYNPFSLRF